MEELSWASFKYLIDIKDLSIQYTTKGDNYYLQLVDGGFRSFCLIPLDESHSDTADFVANYKSKGNQKPNSIVTTQFELDNKDLKVVCKFSDVDTGTGLSTLEFLVPGTFNGLDKKTCNGRYLGGGTVFFTEAHAGDKVTKIEVVDIDNIFGYGAGFIIKTYHDDEAPSDEQGWFIPHGQGAQYLTAETLGGYGWIPSGLYLRLVGKKSDSHYSGKFFTNVFWGKLG